MSLQTTTPPADAARRQLPPTRWVTLCCSAAWLLAACSDPPASPTPPPNPRVQSELATATWGASDPSLPSAESAFRPVNEPRPTATTTAGRSNTGMSPAQESSAMPLPGQNNDHSAPLGPPKRVTTP